jgi:hypothetical protein
MKFDYPRGFTPTRFSQYPQAKNERRLHKAQELGPLYSVVLLLWSRTHENQEQGDVLGMVFREATWRVASCMRDTSALEIKTSSARETYTIHCDTSERVSRAPR